MHCTKTLICAIILVSPAFLFSQQKNLDYFLKQGLQNSPLINEANKAILLNKIDSMGILAENKLQVNGISNNYYAPVFHGYGYDEIITNIGNFNEQVSISKLFTGKKKLNIQFNGIKLQEDSISIAGKISGRDVERTITAAYIAAYGSWRQYKFNDEIYNLFSTEDTLLKKLTQASVYRQTDYLTFLVTLQQQHLAILQAKQQYQNDYATLNYLCGIVDTSFTPLDSPLIELQPVTDFSASVFYKKFITDSLLLKNAALQVGMSYKPKLSITADGGFVSSLTYTPYKNFGFGAGINLIIPIYDGNRRKLQYQRLDILEQERAFNRDFSSSQYRQQIALLSQQLETTNKVINETNDQLKYVHTLIEANRKLLVTGDVHIADFIIAIGNYLTAENTVTQNTIKKLQVITQINYWNKQ